jgi:uncharacterized protein YsxB (DUF464 family)
MTNVIIRKKEDLIFEIEVNGHAMSAQYGNDVVCAGISSVVFGACNSLDELSNYNTEQILVEDGKVLIPNLAKEKNVQLICQVLIVQLKTIERSYPKYISIQ